jgi:hypothetical protein
MKIFRSISILTAVCVPLGRLFAAPAATPAPAALKGFAAYHILQTRNIFDPLRNPFAPAPAPRRQYTAQPPRKSVDLVTLTGIMVNEGKPLAFFSGSRTEDDEVIAVNGDIAGATLTKITPVSVDVNRDGKTLTVQVGQAMAFDPTSGDVTLAAAPPPDIETAAPSAALTAPPPAGNLSESTPTPLPGNLSDVMRRMMERRQQQLQ